jgi:hypothetical protein
LVLLLAKDGHLGARQIDHSEEVGFELTSKVFVRPFFDCPAVGVACVVDHYIETAEGIDNRRNRIPSRFGVSHI